MKGHSFGDHAALRPLLQQRVIDLYVCVCLNPKPYIQLEQAQPARPKTAFARWTVEKSA